MKSCMQLARKNFLLWVNWDPIVEPSALSFGLSPIAMGPRILDQEKGTGVEIGGRAAFGQHYPIKRRRAKALKRTNDEGTMRVFKFLKHLCMDGFAWDHFGQELHWW